MAEMAMSGIAWDGGWAALSSLDELLFFKDKQDKKEINDPALKLTKHEIAEQVLHDIEDLGRNYRDDWLDELPLFDEFQTLTPVELDNSKIGDPKLEQQLLPMGICQQISANGDSLVAEIHEKPPASKDLFSVSCEDAATFLLSNENIIYINNESFVSLDPLQPECMETIDYEEEKTLLKSAEEENPKNAVVEPAPSWTDLDGVDTRTGLAVVEEIVRNTALELDQWESDTTHSEISSDGTSGTDSSSKGKEEETDDPDWKPVPSNSPGRKSTKRAKPYWRGGSQEEKKLRKKEQNKNAATRYRQKKKAEIHEIRKEEEVLKEKKARLEETLADKEHELRCVKAFMREYFKAKGLISD